MPIGQNINEVKIWLLKELNGTISQEEKAQLEAWKKESTANEELAQRIHSAQFLRKAILDSNKQIRQKQWNALWKEIGYTRFPRIEWHKTTRIAAVIALLIACGWMFVYYWQLREEDRFGCYGVESLQDPPLLHPVLLLHQRYAGQRWTDLYRQR